jgi:predicted transcriptional regulator
MNKNPSYAGHRKSTMKPTKLEKALHEGLRESLKVRFKERRGKIEIMVDILSVARGGARKTEIVYNANLNFTRVDRYIPYLEERDLMVNSGPVYRTTKKGEEFLREYQTMKKLLVT